MSNSFSKIQNFIPNCNKEEFMEVVDFVLGEEGLHEEVYERLRNWDDEQLKDFIEYFGIEE